jgi:conjugative relaxase-like TrwC/TraI family protein
MKTSFDIKASNKGYFKANEFLDNSESQPLWAGSLCSGLKLSGNVEHETFLKMQDGILPNGRRMRGKNHKGHEIAAHDMTLSVPKSFTLHALEDSRLVDVHIDACKKTIATAEQHYALYRAGEDRHTELGQGFVASILPHWTNRRLNPQLHAHCILFNGTKTQDSKWRALDMHPISREQWLGNYFLNTLAKGTQELGYTIHEVPMKNGTYGFEVEGISREHIEVFSSRALEIQAAMEEHGWSSQEACYKTRPSKGVQPTLEDLRLSTREARESLGIALQSPGTPKVIHRDATDAVKSAIAHLSERLCKFEKSDIYKRVFSHIEGFDIGDVDAAIAKTPTLLDYGLIKARKGQGRYTTVEALERETRTINEWLGRKCMPVMSSADALARIDPTTVNEGQLEAVLGLLSSNSTHQILHGLSGVGKTRTLKPFKALAESAGIKLRWFAPSLDAAKKLSESIDAPAETLQRLVYTEYKIRTGEILVVDEGGLASAQMIDILVQKANAVGARILLVGDTGQNRPIEAGTPVISLMEAGATTHNVSEILRQKDGIQKRAVTLASCGNTMEALNLLDKYSYVSEIPERDERTAAIANEYLALSPEERANTLIVAGTHAEKDAIVGWIRDGLKAEGVLGDSASITRLRDKGWTKEHGKDIRHYQLGDYIALSKVYKHCPLIKDEFHKIIGIEGSILKVESYGGQVYDFDPAQFIEKRVFSANEMDIAVGDELRWQHTNYKRERKNGEIFTVVGINGPFATIQNAKGKTKRIRLDSPIAVDYTITTTNYRAQGSDRPRVLVSATDDPTSSKEAFYVSISRQIHEIKIWTSSIDALRRRVSRSKIHSNPLKELHHDFIDRSSNRANSVASDCSGEYADRSAQRNNIGGHGNNDSVGHRRTSEQAPGRGKQNPRGFKLNGDHYGLNSNWGGAESLSTRPAERADSGAESVKLTDLGAEQGHLKALTDKILDLAYQQRMSQELSAPLERLAHALETFSASQAKNRHLLREQAIVRAESEAVAIALQQWRASPDARAEDYIGYALDSLATSCPPQEVPWEPMEPSPHVLEFEASCIHPEIIALNAESIDGAEVYDRLLSHKLATMGSGQHVTVPQRRLMDRYVGVAEGGWWAKGGIDPQQMDKPQEWGTFKADSPRMGTDKPIKYESPLGMPRGVFLPYVPDEIAQAIFKKYGIIAPSDKFWEVVRDHNLPIVITEGAKKTWASLSQGIITIGVSGVNGLYITKDANGDKLPKRELNPDIAVFATPGRDITIAFDQDTKPRTIENVRRDMVRGIELLIEAGCSVNVATWGTDTKGLDDLIAKQGGMAYQRAIDEAGEPQSFMDAHYILQYERAISKAVREYPDAPVEFLDSEVWRKAWEDGRRFVGAGAKDRGLDGERYCDELLKNGPQIRVEYLKKCQIAAADGHTKYMKPRRKI